MKHLIAILFCLSVLYCNAQTTVNRKIAQRWDKHDGNSWQGQDSVVYSYNAFGDETERLIQNTPNANQWDRFFRYTSTYDAQQNLKTRLTQQWTNNAWRNVTLYSYSYNASNFQTELIYQTWNNNWNNAGRVTTTYNNNLQSNLTTYGWASNAWTPQSKQDFLYNSSNELITHTFFTFVNNNWENQEKRQYQYAFGQVSSLILSLNDNNNWILSTRTLNGINGSASPPRIVSSSLQRRDVFNNLWEDSLKTTYLYTNNLLSSKEREKYNAITTTWTSLSLSTYAYTSNNLLEDLKNYITNGSSSVYQNQSRSLFTYNGNNLNDKTTHYIDDGNNGWKVNEQDNYTYNANDSLIYRLNEDYTNNAFTPDEQYFYYYKEVPVGLTDLNNLFTQATLYPNPCMNSLQIRTNELIQGAHQAVIYSTDGKIMWSQSNFQPIQKVSYDLSSFMTGNYILQIRELNSGRTQHFKFSKR